MGVEERWGEITEKTICLYLDHVLVLDSLLYRAGEERRGFYDLLNIVNLFFHYGIIKKLIEIQML